MDEITKMISEERINSRIIELANEINDDYKSRDLFVICNLKGATLFTCDLIKRLNMPVTLDFMITSSYGNKTESSGNVEIKKDLDNSIKGKDVLFIDDIVDSGNTLFYLKDELMKKNPNSIEFCTLLDKPDRRVKDINVKYVGFCIPDEFVVGYGLDYDQKYRNLPYVGKIKTKCK